MMPKRTPRRDLTRPTRKVYHVGLDPALASRLDAAAAEMGATASSTIRECVGAGLAHVLEYWRRERANRSAWERERGIAPEEVR